MLHLRWSHLVAGMILPCVVHGGFCDDDGWHIPWQDEFSGSSLDRSRWNIEVFKPSPRTMHCSGEACIGLGSCRDASCIESNANVDDGHLVLTSQRDPHNASAFTTAAVNTWGKGEWHANAEEGPFRVCISAMLPGYSAPGPASQGIWPAHWLMPNDNSCDPDEGEMDIMEMVNGDGLYEATYHWQTTYPTSNCSYPKGHESATISHPLPDFNSTFHEYAVERGPAWVAFVLDGMVLRNITKESQPTPLFWDRPWYLILNTAIGGGWPGSANKSTVFPVQHSIDYVRVARMKN